MASIASLSSFSSLSLLPSLPSPSSFTPSLPLFRFKPLQPSLTLTLTLTLTHCTSKDADPSLSNDAEDNDEDDLPADEDGVSFDLSEPSDLYDTPEPEHEVTAAYEELYGPAYSGESVFGDDIYVMDSKFNEDDEALGFFEDDDNQENREDDGYEERVVQVKRVTKVVKGGKNMSFRAVVVVGNLKGRVGVGMGKAREVVDAIKKAAANGRRNIIEVPLSKDDSFPHR